MKIGNYIGTVPYEADYITYDLGVNEYEDISLYVFDMEEEDHELELMYTDM